MRTGLMSVVIPLIRSQVKNLYVVSRTPGRYYSRNPFNQVTSKKSRDGESGFRPGRWS